MNRFRVAIIEDEVPAAVAPFPRGRSAPQWEIEVLPGSVDEAAAWFAVNDHPDLLFLDIRLSDGTSFDLLSKVRPASAVIFTTAYDEYAIRAFSVNSIDYLLKPVDKGAAGRCNYKIRKSDSDTTAGRLFADVARRLAEPREKIPHAFPDRGRRSFPHLAGQ